MPDKSSRPAPAIVGGLNGSGTRVVAQLMLEMNYYLGQDFNSALDNLWFTILLKRPHWFSEDATHTTQVCHVLDTLTRLMLGDDSLTWDNWRSILGAASVYSLEQRSNKVVWSMRRLWRITHRQPIDLNDYHGWGWKEPHSHFYLPHLAQQFPHMKYIHVIRHGLDMAYSSNQEQLNKWGHVLDVAAPRSRQEQPAQSLQFWIQANQRAVRLGEALLDDHFMLLNYDNLCMNPGDEIGRLIAFLDVSGVDMDTLEKIPRLPKSKDRYLQHDSGVFASAQLDAVRAFGFVV